MAVLFVILAADRSRPAIWRKVPDRPAGKSSVRIMKQAWITVAVFVAGTVLGFLAIAGGFLAWAMATDFVDREGSTGMAVVFIEAPVGGLLIGVVAALITSRIQARRQRS